MDPVTLTTGRLTIRPLGPQDIDAVYAACQDPEVGRWTTTPTPYRREDAESFAGTIAPEAWVSGKEYCFAVLDKQGRLVAVTGLMERVGNAREIGFWAVKEHRGQGYMTEAVRAVTRWGFEELGADRIEWKAEVGNHASRAVAEKAGFRLEGTLRSGLLNKGTRRDAWVASLLPSDIGLPTKDPYLPAEG
ncbi:GNAT family N-acetyltransferase [Streptomyces sp. N35]|uniref:GNAT family N-acetyltransferase n=1 Tax=Streptomyces sp. N35 TaxID=2795730 RepID=UPI0018F39031|nr:GNAT family N-acetyltransferase [Streptomyces sp. N35]